MKVEIVKGIEVYSLGLFIKKEKMLIISDLHLGFESALRDKGIFLPKVQFEDILKEIKKLIKKFKPKTIVINGDIKHEFGKRTYQEFEESKKLLSYLLKKAKVIVIRGNHDNYIVDLLKKLNIKFVEFLKVNSIFITHGHKYFEESKNAKVIIIGHEHPAITLRDEFAKEEFKAFLKIKNKDKVIIVTPSLSNLLYGSFPEKFLSPYLKGVKLSDIDVFIPYNNEIFYIGKLSELI